MRRFFQPGTTPQIIRLVELAQRHLGMDVTYVAEFQDGQQQSRALAGDPASFGLQLGTGVALEDSYCQLLVDGQIPNVVPDSSRNARVRDLKTTEVSRIGSYIGVPLYLPGGKVYGTFCCLSHDPTPDLTARDVGFLSMLAELLEEEIAAEAQRRQQRDLLGDVIARQDFSVALQPVVDLSTGTCTSVEALARFPDHIGSPDVAFAAADQAGLRLKLETATATAAFRMRPKLSGTPIAINCSAEVACELVPRAPSDLRLDRVILELTEHEAVNCYAVLRERLRAAREQGLRLAIDDAGAGFASLRHIVELTPDIIKIDRSLVAGVPTDRARRSVVTTFVLMALDIGATVVAEGVETADELEAVAELGVDAVQGYLIARPSSDPLDVGRWTHGAQLLPPHATHRDSTLRPNPAARA